MQKETCRCGASFEVRIGDGRAPYTERERELLNQWKESHRCKDGSFGSRKSRVSIERDKGGNPFA